MPHYITKTFTSYTHGALSESGGHNPARCATRVAMSSEQPCATTTSERSTTSDWTETLPPTDHVRFFKSVDWAQTALGPAQQWGTALRMYTHMVMSDSRPATLYW
jgi:hypothetical protein